MQEEKLTSALSSSLFLTIGCTNLWEFNSSFKCCDTVGWVILPVKSSPKWPIMCRVGR